MKKLVLGKQVEYPKQYSPEVLVSIPRKSNRKIYDIDEKKLPFTGFDVWHAYEFSFLTNLGLPVVGVLKMVVPTESPYIVESKSLKLYLNSFNMEDYGNSVSEGISMVLEVIKEDLSKLLKCKISLSFFDIQDNFTPFDFSDYQLLEKNKEAEYIIFSEYTEKPDLLLLGKKISGDKKVATHLLRSNCKITQQPDWGSAFIYMKGEQLPSYEGLLRYLVSIRNENHFHEEICEMIYQRLNTLFSPEKLMVTCIYTRRGGIDICPVRVSADDLLPENLCNTEQLTFKLLRQ